MFNSIRLNTPSNSIRVAARVAVLVTLAAAAWGGDALRLSVSGGGRGADGLIIDYKMGEALPGVVSANVISNLGSVPFSVTVQSSGWLSVTPLTGTTPAVIAIAANPAGLGVGQYTGSITVNTTVQLNGKILDASDTSPVTLRIAQGTPAAAAVAPASLSFAGSVGQSLASQAVVVSSTPGSVNFTVGSTAAWLSASPVSGITNGAAGQSVNVFVNTVGLAAGDYSGSLTILTPGATPASLSVAVDLKLRSVITPLTEAPPATLNFKTVEGGQIPAGQSFGLAAGTKNLNFTVATNAAWLSATPVSGQTPGVVTVQANSTGLAAGTYQGIVETTVAEAVPAVSQTAVTLTVDKAPAPVPQPLTAAPGSLSFAGTVGGANPPAGLVSVSDPASGSGVAVTVAADVAWLAVTPASGAAPFSVQVQAQTAGLAAGQRTGKVTFTRTDVTPNLVTTVTVTLGMVDGPVINLSPSSVNLQGKAGDPNGSAPVSLMLTTTSAAAVGYELTLTSAGGWLTAPGGGLTGVVSTGAPVTVSVQGSAAALASGSYDGAVSLKIPGQSSGGATVPVVFVVAPKDPALTLTPKQLSFSGLAGGAATAAQKVDIATNPGLLPWTANWQAAWLKVSAASGVGTQPIQVAVDPGKLAPGKYSDVINVMAGSGEVSVVTVTVDVQPASAPAFGVDPASLEFTKMQGTQVVGQQTASLTGLTAEIAANTVIQWSATAATKSGGNWLSAELVNPGTLPVTVKVYADPTGLAAGVYDGVVQVTASADTVKTVELAVRLTVTAAKSLSYAINPAAVSAERVQGSVEKELVDVALVPAQAGLGYTTVAAGGGWLTVSGNGSGQMPATVHAVMDPAGLKPGVYRGTVTVTATTAEAGAVLTNPDQVIDLVLTVKAPPPPSVKVSGVGGGGLVFDLDHPNDNPGTVTLASLRNEGSGVVPVKIASDTPWLTFASGSIAVGTDVAGVPLVGVLNAAAAPGRAGSYVAGYTLTVDGVGIVYTGSVGLTVKSSAPRIELAPSGATLTLGEGYSAAPVAFSVKNTGSAAQTLAVTPGGLLTANQGGALTLQPGESVVLTFAVINGLTAGVYTSLVRLVTSTKGGSLETAFSVGIEVLARPPLSVTGGGYVAVAPGGWGQIQIVLKNPRMDAAAYYVSAGPLAGTTALSGVSIDPTGGFVPPNSELTVTVAGQTGSAFGLYGQTVAVNFGGEPFIVPMVVGALPQGSSAEGKSRSAAGCDSGRLLALFLNVQDGTVVKSGLPSAIQMLVVNSCGGLVTKGVVSAAPSNGDGLIEFQPGASAGYWVGTWTPVNTSSPEVSLTVTAWDEVTQLRGTAKVRMALHQVAAIPALTAVVNPADGGTEGATAAGGWVSITGKNLAVSKVEADVKPYPLELGGTKVLLGERALPLMMVSPGEVVAFVPYDVAVGSVAPLQVVRGQAGSTTASVEVNAQMPALFLKDPKDASREGRVAASRGEVWFDADLGNPVKAGDVLYIEAISLGAVDQDVSPDKVAPEAPLARVQAKVTATIGGVAADVWYAGLIPGTVGVYQVRLGVPEGVTPANDVPIVVTIDGTSSTAVTVAVR